MSKEGKLGKTVGEEELKKITAIFKTKMAVFNDLNSLAKFCDNPQS